MVTTARSRSSSPAAALVVLRVGQLVSGGLVSTFADSPTMQADRPGEPAITPRGYAYAIWGLIEGFTGGSRPRSSNRSGRPWPCSS